MAVQQRIRIGTRGSALARKQAEIASFALQKSDPSLLIDVLIIETYGDRHQEPVPLDSVGKGWFTKEIERALLENQIDIAVHSLKDIEDEVPGLSLGAYLPRVDARDVLITKNGESFAQLKKGAVIGTDSIRRQIQIIALRGDLRTKSLRGNVPTRLEKLKREKYDAIIIAAAGLIRLELQGEIRHFFAPHEITPAPGQGTLALQIRQNDDVIRGLVERVDDESAARASRLERSFSSMMGGGCTSPVGAHAFQMEGAWHLIGMVQHGKRILREEIEGEGELGETLAKKMRAHIRA